jgi:SAM-dependent methyltransferase
MDDARSPSPPLALARPGAVDSGWSVDRTAPGRFAGSTTSDAAFDRCLDERLQALSAQHWTPFAVATRAAEWLEAARVRTVLDIGSGVGKFCVAAALSSRCHFTGLEQRLPLVACARSLARTFGVDDRTYFIHGALGSARLPAVDAYYLYNPFEENILGGEERIDDHVALSADRHARDLRLLGALLARAPGGTYVLTYNGCGGALPGAYRKVRIARDLPNELCLWRKAPSRLVVGARQGASGCASAA